MPDFMMTWQWPQWTLIVLLFLSWIIAASEHGKPMVKTSGDEKGQPLRHSFPVKTTQIAVMLLLLTAGGFFS